MVMEQDDLHAQAVKRNGTAYTDKVIDHAMRPRNLGNIENADGYARIKGPCGDTMEVWLNVKNHLITDIGFMTDGCGTSLASGSMMTELAKNKNIGEAQQINQQAILDALGDLPEESRHCALLAANTLNAAVKDCIVMKRDLWKKLYRR